jgi:hypothetical protein
MPNWVIIQNDSGEVIEGNSLVRVTGVDSDGNFIVDKPNRDGQTDLFISGPGSIPDGSYGQAHNEFPAVVKYDTANETNAAPADGEIWGAKAGSWKLTRKMPGFRILGSGVQEKCIIARATTSLIVFVYVTSATASSGRYSATEKFFDPVAGTWSDGDAVWYNDANGAVPTVNTYHQAMLVGFANGRKCYREAVVGGSSSLTVKEADGTPSYSSITSLELNQADGFEVTQPGAGRANINIKDASASQAGIVALANQQLGTGRKDVESLGILDPAGGSTDTPVFQASHTPDRGVSLVKLSSGLTAQLGIAAGELSAGYEPGHSGTTAYSLFEYDAWHLWKYDDLSLGYYLRVKAFNHYVQFLMDLTGSSSVGFELHDGSGTITNRCFILAASMYAIVNAATGFAVEYGITDTDQAGNTVRGGIITAKGTDGATGTGGGGDTITNGRVTALGAAGATGTDQAGNTVSNGRITAIATDGFTGTGAYTNFTITNGRITAAS